MNQPPYEHDDEDEFCRELARRQARKKKQAHLAAFSFGLMMLAIGLILAAFQIGWPIYQALHQAPEIHVSVMWSVAAVIITAFGLASMCGLQFLTNPQDIYLKDFLIMAILLAAGFGGWWAFKMFLESRGYFFPPL